MDLSVGNLFPAPSVIGRLQNQMGMIENAARIAARHARNWWSRAGEWCGVTSEEALRGSCLPRELERLQNEMLSRTGIRIALGAGSSRVVAGTASRSAGHGAPQVVAAGRERAFLAPLPLQNLCGLPAATLRVLRASGMVTIGELQRVPKAALQAEFGNAEGLRLWKSARGIDSPPDSRQGPFRAEPAADSEALLSGALRQRTRPRASLLLRDRFPRHCEIAIQNAQESQRPSF
jgi:nucleotidyltransferase/DNA polymerase involved in DNA repair